jgi:putative ABC transport system permease protein
VRAGDEFGGRAGFPRVADARCGIMNPLPLALAELRHNRAAVLAVAVLIALAVSLGVAVSAQERALRKSSAAAAEPFDVIIGMPGSQTQLVLTTVYLQPAALELVPGKVLQVLQNTPGVGFAAPIAFGDYLGTSPIVGSTAALLTLGGSRPMAEGRSFEKVHEAVVGAHVAAKLGDVFEPAHGAPGGEAAGGEAHVHHGFDYTVVGRLPATGTPWDNAIIVPVEAVWVVHALPSGHSAAPAGAAAEHDDDDENAMPIGPPWLESEMPGVPAIVVKANSVGDAYRLRAELRRGGTTAVFPAEILLDLYSTLGDARDVLAIISIAAQALVIAAVLLAVFAVIAARRQQLAVLRALGASRSFVFALVWCQVMIMIAAGALIGLGIGWFGAQAISRIVEARTGLAVAATIARPELVMVLSLMLVGALLAVVPGITSYRRPVSEGLRSS